MRKKRGQFVEKILELSDMALTNDNLRQANSELRDSFLKEMSHTPDNRQCIEFIEYGESRERKVGPKSKCGLKLINRSYLLSDVIYELETEEGYRILEQKFPDLTRDEIEAALRISTTLMLSLECYEVPEDFDSAE